LREQVLANNYLPSGDSKLGNGALGLRKVAVNTFCPDGYVPIQKAVFRAAEYLSPDRLAALERAAAPQSGTERTKSEDALARALSESQISPPWQDPTWRHEFEDVWSQAADRLRNFLHQDMVRAYYFTNDGCHHLSREFWATAQADSVLEIDWPFGATAHGYEQQRPNYRLFVKQLDLDRILSDQPAKKLPFPVSKLPELVTAMRTHNDKPNRKELREALRKLPEFEPYQLTDAVFREAERQVPRNPGRKAPNPEQ
jgi:hypothetical protein